MPVAKRKLDFFETEEGIMIEEELRLMASSDLYNTADSYSANYDAYPDNLIPFVDKHKNYLLTHPTVKPEMYVANLRLMTRMSRK